jgi:hypothetical protein
MTVRQCGSCTLCCKLLPVRELEKPGNTRCIHQSRKGCGIYRKPGFPPSCHLWSCRWLVADDTTDMIRPDRAGYVIDLMPDILRLENNDSGELVQEVEVVQIWVEAGTDPLRDKRLLRYAERQAKRGVALLLRYSDGAAKTVFAPALASDGHWHIFGDDEMRRTETQSGSLLLDTLRAAIEPS